MPLTFPLAILLSALALPVTATAAPVPKAPEATAYAAVDKAINNTLAAIRADLLKLNQASTFPQLSGIEKSEIRSSNISWKETSLHHSKDAAWVAGDFFKFGKDGGRILVNLRSYDAESDPRIWPRFKVSPHSPPSSQKKIRHLRRRNPVTSQDSKW